MLDGVLEFAGFPEREVGLDGLEGVGEDAAGQVTPVGGLRSETGDHFGFRQGGHLG